MAVHDDADEVKSSIREDLAHRYGERIEALIPLARELARKAGPHGVTVGDIRLTAEQRGLLERGTGRSLSWLTSLPKAAGLVSTGKRRISPIGRSRNDHVIYVAAEYAGKDAA